MKRALSLKKETLAEIGPDDLRSVLGAGTHITCATGITYCELCDIQFAPLPTHTCTT